MNSCGHLLVQRHLKLYLLSTELSHMPKKTHKCHSHIVNTDSSILVCFFFISNTIIMKPILDVREQTCLGSFEPEWQLLLQSPKATSKSASHLFQMVRGE